MLALFERCLRRLALDDFLFQLQVRGGQFHRALAQHFDNFIQVEGGLPHVMMSFLNRDDRLGEKSPRPPDERAAFAVRNAGQHLGHQDLFMEPGNVQRLQSGGRRPPAQAASRPQVRLPALL